MKSIAATYAKYPSTGALLPAMGYGDEQMKDLEVTINQTPCDTVIIGTPIDLRRFFRITKPSVRVGYGLEEVTRPDLEEVLAGFLKSVRRTGRQRSGRTGRTSRAARARSNR